MDTDRSEQELVLRVFPRLSPKVVALLSAFPIFWSCTLIVKGQVLAPASVVKPHSYVSLEPVPRGKEFEVAVVVDIARGYHMNSHKPTDPYLIATTITPQLPAGIQLTDTIYPPGKLEKFTFSPDKALDVYSGTVTLRLKLSATSSAALGNAAIPITLRYQACNDSACLPPVKVPVNVGLTIADATAKARATHPEIFARQPAN